VRGRQALPPQPEPSEGALDPGEVSRLLSRGQAFLNQGDVSAARLALQRVAEAGEPRAALALGATYDPMILKRMGMVGIKPDVEKARSWYERAASLGSAEANQRLNALGQFGR
jgi:TPR repeat protein